MSSVVTIRRLLVANSALTAIVPSAKIFAGVVPLNAVLPAIGVTSVSAVPRNTASMKEPDRMATSRVQVTVFTKSYPQKKQLLNLVRQAVPNTNGMVGSVMVLSVLPDIVGPDLDDTDAQIYSQSRDYKVSYIE